MTMLKRVRMPIDDRERGVALVTVIGVSAILSALLIAAVAYGMGSMRKAQSDSDWNAALAAAYAGVEEYESRLANDTGYHAFGNPAATFSAGSAVSLPTATGAENPAFGLGPTGTWGTVAGSGGKAQFRYEVDKSMFNVDNTLRLRSTGRVGKETRTIVADLKQLGFIDFLYFTDFEVRDPQATNPNSTTNCAIHYYDPVSRSACSEIFFGGADEINGPMHTNDAFQTNGQAKFNGKTTTSYKAASGKNYIRDTGTAPIFKYPADDPAYVGTIGMPATNAELKKETRSDLGAEVPNTGCLYTGPTSIEFHSNGTMTVISPWTVATNTTGVADTGGSAPPKCGTPGVTGLAKSTGGGGGGGGGTRRYVGETIDIPANSVIYVQSVPTAAGNVNRTASTSTPPGTPSVSCASSGNAIGYPMSSETVPFSSSYGCRNGDAFVKGDLRGNITIAAENYIYVTGDIEYVDEDRDMLGLVGNNAVWVWNPYSGSSALLPDDRRIDAAILSVAHTFMVQNYDKGGNNNRGVLTINGAIAQKFRGPVGQGSGGSISTGYAKDYNYDDRFQRTAPPKFLSPVTTTYGVNVWVEVGPAFDSNGNYR